MKSGHIVFMIMVFIFLFFELAYALVAFEVEYINIARSLAKSALLFLFIILYSKKVKWAKWILTILVLINGMVCLFDGIEDGNILFFAISAYSLFFVFCIHRLKMLRLRYDVDAANPTKAR
jgi:hypothetical protein